MDTAKLARVRRLTSNGTAKTIRLAAGVSIPEVAAEVGCAISTVFRWENGQRAPRGEAAERYADVLDRLMVS